MFQSGVHTIRWPLHIPGRTVRAVDLIGLVVRSLREMWCGLRGHDMVLHYEPERLSLRCLECGVRTQGWAIHVNPVYRIHRPLKTSRTSR